MGEQAAENAVYLGQQAGRLGLSPNLNPYQYGSVHFHEWERARRTVLARRIAADLRMRARTPICRYINGQTCECQGKGHCLDIA